MSLNESLSVDTEANRSAEQFSLALDPVVHEGNVREVGCINKAQGSAENNSFDEPQIKYNIKASSIWVSMPNGEQLHMRHLLPVDNLSKTDLRLDIAAGVSETSAPIPVMPKRVFMLHGEVECGRIFYHESGKGLAYHFAEQGYEVFVADLGGRGRSLCGEGQASSLTIHDIVTDAIPRLLRAVTHHNPWLANDIGYNARFSEAPTIWVAHGFGGVLLSAAWARMNDAERTATQMIFLGARRKWQAKHYIANAFVKIFCHPLTARLVSWHNAFPATRMRLGSADENAHWFRVYSHWISSDDWRDPEDGFDYQAALKVNPIPAAMHFATAADKVYSDASDVRAFIEELGCHDARMMVLDTIGDSKRKYDHLSLLLDSAAANDVFSYATDWLAEQYSECKGSALSIESGSVEEPLMQGENVELPFEASLDENAFTLDVLPLDDEIADEKEKSLVLCA